jgi:hypothetical protein
LRQAALTSDLRADPVDWHTMTAWKRLALMGLMVCLPIPLLAASGLAVPLPSVVYRVAVGVAERTQAVAVRVPGFEAVVAETKQVARHGKIRLAPEELAVADSPTRAAVPAAADRPRRVRRVRPSTLRPASRPKGTKEPAPRETPLKLGAPSGAEARAVAAPAPDTQEAPRAQDTPAREERIQEKSDSAPAGNPSPGSPAGTGELPEPRSSAPREEPKPSPPAEEPRNAPGDTRVVPPPPRTTPPPPVPPLPVALPIDPLPEPEPVPVTPATELEAIADELRKVDELLHDDGSRVGGALQKVESALARLEKTPPDKQGAVGDIKNAVQKLDAALAEGEIDLVERTSFVTRLNAVSAQLKVAP